MSRKIASQQFMNVEEEEQNNPNSRKGDDIAGEGDINIPIPIVNNYLSPMVSVVPLQLIAYHAALALGCDVDRPRNLAKSSNR